MAFIKKIGHLFAPEKSLKKHAYDSLLQRNVNPYDFWTVEAELGDGSFGKVYRAASKETCMHVALKEVPVENDEDMEDHMIELSILNDCKHKNVVSLFEAYFYDEKIMMVLEYCGGGAVDNIMIELDKPLTEAQIRYTCHELCEGLSYLHKCFVIHRDIKAGNILLTLNGMVKLADFGVSTKDNRPGVKHTTFIGTPYWMAPEVAICDAVKDVPYDCKADIWSLGVTLIELAQMQPPHHEMSPMRVIMRILKSDPPTLDRPFAWSREFSEFLTECLVKNPDSRSTSAELLEHPFIKDATDPQPLLLLLAEFRADVSETQEEVTDPDIIKRFSRHRELLNSDDAGSVAKESSAADSSPSVEKRESVEDMLHVEEKHNTSPEEIEAEMELETFSPEPLPELQGQQGDVAPVKLNFPFKVLEAVDAPPHILDEAVDVLTLEVISDDVTSPSVPECVEAAISEYVIDQCPKSSAGNTEKREKSSPQDETTKRRLPRSSFVPHDQATPPSMSAENVEMLPVEAAHLSKRLSVSEMAKILSVKLGHSVEKDEMVSPEEKVVASASVKGKGLPRSSLSSSQASPPGTTGTGAKSTDQAIITRKQPPPLPPRNASTSLSYQEQLSTAESTYMNTQKSAVTQHQEEVMVRHHEVPDIVLPTPNEGREGIERSASRYRTLVKVRRFEFGGRTVTTSTSHLIVTEEGNSTAVDRGKAFARERRRHLRELKVLQKVENKAYQEMLTKSNLELDQLAKRTDSERENVLARYENEEEVLRQQQKQNLEAVERLQAREMKTLVKRLNEQQEREFKTLRESGKDELKALEREIGRLPKELRKQTLRIKTTMKQDELARRESDFVKRQEEKMHLEKRALCESHRGDLLRLEQQFLEQQQHIRRKREADMAQLEERLINEKHALSQRHILAAYKLKQQQMSTRHMRELTRLRTESDHMVTELRQSHTAEMKLIPRKIREESKVRLQMYKEKLRIENKKNGISDVRLGFMSLVGDGVATLHREKIREFEMEEKRRKEEYQERVERRHKIAVAKLEKEIEVRIKETEVAHCEALRQLSDAEATKLNELDREFQEELLRCRNTRLVAQSELEARFKEELEDQRRFYHVPLTSTTPSPSSTGATGVSLRSSKSVHAALGLPNDDSLSSGTASSSETHQRQYNQQHYNGNSHSGGGLPRTTLMPSDYDLGITTHVGSSNGSGLLPNSADLQQHFDRNGHHSGPKTRSVYSTEML